MTTREAIHRKVINVRQRNNLVANLRFISPCHVLLFGTAESNCVLQLLSATEGSRLQPIGSVQVQPDGNFETKVQFQNTSNPIKVLSVVSPTGSLSAVINVITMQAVKQLDGVSSAVPLDLGEAPETQQFQPKLAELQLPKIMGVEAENAQLRQELAATRTAQTQAFNPFDPLNLLSQPQPTPASPPSQPGTATQAKKRNSAYIY